MNAGFTKLLDRKGFAMSGLIEPITSELLFPSGEKIIECLENDLDILDIVDINGNDRELIEAIATAFANSEKSPTNIHMRVDLVLGEYSLARDVKDIFMVKIYRVLTKCALSFQRGDLF